MVINVYERFFRADAVFSGVQRNGALVLLISDSKQGFITYTAAVSFFPHNDPEDFAVSYDAYFEKELASGKGRRSRKREAQYIEQLPAIIGELAGEHNARVFFEEPLSEERRG